MIRIIYIILFGLLIQPAFSQMPFQAVLDSVEINNKILSAGRQMTESQKLNAKTGIYLANPTVSYDRLNNSAGSYSEMIVSQSFDFPSAYFQKSKIANLTVSQADEQYRQAKLEIGSELARVFAEIVYSNRKISILTRRQMIAQQLQTGIEKRLQTGDANIFETNRVRSELAKTHSELRITENRRNALNLKLSELNGGRPMEIADTTFTDLPGFTITDTSANTILTRNPQVRQWETEIQITEMNINLQRSLSYPKFEIGYRQDMNTGQNYNGIHAGISIPLFENKNMVRTAKARQMYAMEASDAYRLELQSKVSQLIEEYRTVQQSAISINEVFKTLNTPDLLVKAYKTGQISYTEFFTEYENYQQMVLYVEDLNLKASALQLQLYVLSGL